MRQVHRATSSITHDRWSDGKYSIKCELLLVESGILEVDVSESDSRSIRDYNRAGEIRVANN